MSDITYWNFRQQLVEELYPSVSKKMDCCTCDRCRADAIAITLNNLPPKYVVSTKGEALARYTDFLTQQRLDVTKELIIAIMKVTKNPNHE